MVKIAKKQAKKRTARCEETSQLARSKQKGKTKTVSSVRTDIWKLAVTPELRAQLCATVGEYRFFLKPLVLIAYWNWSILSNKTSKEKVNYLEKLCHQTKKNTQPKYGFYFQKALNNHPSFRKFPSYLRRAAIAAALGIVSSFVTRWNLWKNSQRRFKKERPPKLTASCNSYPSLYKGQQILYHEDFQTVSLKIWDGNDWVWTEKIPVISFGKNRHKIQGNKLQSPALIANSKKLHLSMPVDTFVPSRKSTDYVVAIDLGINTTATLSMVGKNGTVKARKFINPARDIDRRDQRKMRIKKKSRQSRIRTGENFYHNFCSGLYRKSRNINREIARFVACEIVKFAKQYEVKTIVFEDLSKWKAKGGRKGSQLKQGFHNWCKDKIVELTTNRWSEVGGEVVTVNPKYTSAYAYDGTGKLKRDTNNYSQALFTSGKRYNADLNAAYNIGARYWYQIITKAKSSRVWAGKSSPHSRRTPVTLASLWELKTCDSVSCG